MEREPTGVAKHLEDHLGPVQNGREFALPGQAPFFVVEFADRPTRGARTFATLGLSEHVLAQPAGGSALRQELLFAAGNADPSEAALLLAAVARDVTASATSLDRGAVLGPHGPLFPGSHLEALYCAPPVYFPDGLAKYGGMTPPVVLVWLVPLTAKEASFASRRGFAAFEALLQEQDPDLLDIQRPEMALG